MARQTQSQLMEAMEARIIDSMSGILVDTFTKQRAEISAEIAAAVKRVPAATNGSKPASKSRKPKKNNGSSAYKATHREGTGPNGNGVEVHFNVKPDEDTRTSLGIAGFTWNPKVASNAFGVRGCWYARANNETLRIARGFSK